MPKPQLPVYQIQDFNAQAQKEQYFYLSSFAAHLQEHLFIREPHKHSFYIVLLITQGKGTHTIDFKKYEVEPDTVFFMAPGQVHSWELSDDADGFVAFFTPEFYLREFPHKELFSFPFFNTLLNKPVLSVTPDEKHALVRAFQLMQQEYVSKELMRSEMLSRYLDVLLIRLTRIYHAQENVAEVQGGELSLLQKFVILVEQQYKEHLPVTAYADQLNVTAKHLKEVCKQSLGKTTNELVQERLLLEAQRLLVHSGLTASQIAADLGYLDAAYFFRFFKKHTRLTPEQFRSQNK
ncbi:helix-turn-helix domain-containing protein [Pontibacter korlensis]|uniref:AraC family transcriptional regulator n=1 Tax=Pontibacter korlensis TaxID=400092 RepID=A0A0E3ZGN0_9BACT|nr:helix-turn-helix domain-containing protein [Pontibacter korlensis]AKD04078.1 AraC family transcriptional regulator [Pontibacter korlensis]